MKINDRIKVVDQCFGGNSYPWIPDLIGKLGTVRDIKKAIKFAIKSVAECSDDDDVCYLVLMDEPFEIDRPPEGEHAYGYEPQKERMKTEKEWAFTGDEIELVQS
jgi:hypothetical protein